MLWTTSRSCWWRHCSQVSWSHPLSPRIRFTKERLFGLSSAHRPVVASIPIRALLPGTSRSIFPEIPRCWSTICRARPVWLRPTTCIKRRGLMASRLAPLLAACFYNRCSDGMSWSMPVQWKKKQTGSPKLTNRYQPTSIRESANRKRLFEETE
jgi:hypothetical protein